MKIRSLKTVWQKRTKILLLLKVGIILALVALFVVCFHYSLWTFANPSINVPDPVEVPVANDPGDPSTSVLFLGDTAPADKLKKKLKKKGYTFPYAKTRSLLNAHDAVVANLESPLTTQNTPSPLRPTFYTYRAHPDAAKALKEVGITAVSLANNHAKDYLSPGLQDTIEHLNKNGVSHFGAGMSEAEARRGLVLKTGSGNIGLLAYMENQQHWRLKNLSFALDFAGFSWSGVAKLNEADVAKDIKRMRSSSELVFVIAHWGKNYKPITDSQKRLGKLLIDLGADAVIGHHSHEVQPIGVYKGRPIIYSLGNYAFDTPGKRSMKFGFGTAFYIEKNKIDKIEIIPLLTQNRLVKYRPRIPKGKDLDEFFDFLIPRSKKLGATITRQGNRGFLAID